MSKPMRLSSLIVLGLLALGGLLAFGRSTVAQGTPWRGEYFSNPTLSGIPTIIRYDGEVDFNWWDGPPALGLPSDNFSVRWTKDTDFSGGTYRFAATMDDGARVYLDGNLIIDAWYPSAAHTVSRDVAVPAGRHLVTMEYFDRNGSAVASLDITPVTVGPPGGGNGGDPTGLYPNWKGEYFTNPTVSGAPVMVRDDRYIDMHWGQGSPAAGLIPNDYFSVRWTRTSTYPAGQYKLQLTSDDGARMWINGVQVVNDWDQPNLAPATVDYWHSGGPATIRIDYFDRTGNAVVVLDLIQVPGGSGVLPPGYPGSGGGGAYNPIPQCPGVAIPTGLSAVVISASNLNVRQFPTTLSEGIGQAPSCSTIQLTGFRDSTGLWVQTTVNGLPGWVLAEYLVTGVPVSSLTSAD